MRIPIRIAWLSRRTVDTTNAQYEAISDRAVRVNGSRFIPAEKYTVKIEGAALAGYRSIVVAGIRDPLILRQLDKFLDGLRVVVERKIEDSLKLSRTAYTCSFVFTVLMAHSDNWNLARKWKAMKSASSSTWWRARNPKRLIFCQSYGTPDCIIPFRNRKA